MSLRNHTLTLIALNLLLFAGLLYRASLVRELPPPELVVVERASPPAGVPAPGSNSVAKAVRQVPPGAPTAFAWRDLESTNYFQFVTNLAVIGCPSETIRDIVLARVADDYARRIWALYQPMQARFWDLVSRGAGFHEQPLVKELNAQAEHLRQEQAGVRDALESLLGDLPEPVEQADARRWNFLPVEKQRQIEQIERDFAEFQARMKKRQRSVTLNEKERLDGLVDEGRRTIEAAIAALLTEDEAREAKLRSSRHARWAAGLAGVELSAEEIAAVVRHLDVVDAAVTVPPRGDPGRAAQLAAAEQLRAEKLLGALGAEKFAAVQRAKDADYQQLLRINRRLSLPVETANAAYEVKRAATAQANRIATEAAFNDAAKAAAYQALQSATANELQRVLGQQAWPVFEQYGGGWWKQFGGR